MNVSEIEIQDVEEGGRGTFAMVYINQGEGLWKLTSLGQYLVNIPYSQLLQSLLQSLRNLLFSRFVNK